MQSVMEVMRIVLILRWVSRDVGDASCSNNDVQPWPFVVLWGNNAMHSAKLRKYVIMFSLNSKAIQGLRS